MKKLFTLLLAGGLVASSFNAKAQQESGEIVTGAQVGWSLIGGLAKAVSDNIKVSPVIQAAGDYGITDNFSVGFATSIQTIKYNEFGYYVDQNFNRIYGEADLNIKIFTAGIRTLFHYGNSENFDMYSGLRATYANISINSSIDGWETGANFKGSGPALQVILFGARAYFNDFIGANFEVGIGKPYVFAAGTSIRF